MFRNKTARILDTGTDTDTDQQLYSECLVFIDKIKQVRTSTTKFNKFKLKQSQGGIHDTTTTEPQPQ